MTVNRFPDKETWDKIADEAFNSETIHEFSESYNRKKAAILSEASDEYRSEIIRKRTAAAAFTAVCAAAAGVCIFTNINTRIPEGSSQMLDLSAVSESENIKKDNNNNNVPAETSAENVSETYEITEKSELSETFRITEKESVRESDTQPAVTEVPVRTEAPSVSQAPSVHSTAAVTSVSENNSAKPVTTYDEPEMTVPATETTEPVINDKEELPMRKELASTLALLMAYSSAGGVIHASDLKYNVPREGEIAVYIDENKDSFDFDSSGKFDVKDIYALYSYFNNREELPEGYAEKIEEKADVTSDNMVTKADLDMFIGYAQANIPWKERVSFYVNTTTDEDIIYNDDDAVYETDNTDALGYGSEDFQYSFYRVMSIDCDDIFTEPVYNRFCDKADSGEISLDVNGDGKTDMTDMYRLYLYMNFYNEKTGKAGPFNPLSGEFDDNGGFELPDADKIAVYAEKICEIYPDYYTSEMYRIAFRYFIEHNDISEEYFDVKTYENVYGFEYGEEYRNKWLTLEEVFLNYIADEIKTNTINTAEHHLTERADGLIFDLFDDHAEVFGYRGKGGKLIIPSEVEGLPVTVIGKEAMSKNDMITEVVIPDTVTKIGYAAFNKCYNLEKVNLPETLTEIESYAFDDCAKLTEVVIPEGITVINPGTFFYCTGLSRLVIPDEIKRIDDFAFQGCGQLTDVVIPDGVEYVGKWAFGFCEKLESVTVPESVTTIGDGAFTNDYTDFPFEYISSVLINGYAGSEAERYAAENGLKFVDVENPETVAEQPKPLKQTVLSAGDINGDGIADVTDLSWLSLSLLGENELTDEQKAAADVDNDGSVRLTDLARFRQFISKVIEAF